VGCPEQSLQEPKRCVGKLMIETVHFGWLNQFSQDVWRTSCQKRRHSLEAGP